MKTSSLLTFVVAGAALFGPLSAGAQSSPPERVGEDVVAAKAGSAEMMVTVDVIDIDKAERLLTVKGPRGNITTFYVDKSVAAFDKVKVGDQIFADYRAAVAIGLRKGGEGIRKQVESEYSSPVSGYKAGKVQTRRTTLVANVEDIDTQRQTATLKGPNGRVVEVEVQDPKVMAEIAKGDQVVAVIDETVALVLKSAAAPR